MLAKFFLHITGFQMTFSLIKYFLSLSRLAKRLIMAFVDVFLVIATVLCSFSMRLGEWYWPQGEVTYLIFLAPVLALPVFAQFGLYREIIRYIGFKALWVVVQAVTFYALAWGVLIHLSAVEGIPRSVILINWFMAMLFIGSSRMLARWWFSGKLTPTLKKSSDRKRVVIYGAGSAGIQLAAALAHSKEMKPVAFIDDDKSLLGHNISGLKVHAFDEMPHILAALNVQEVLLAMPSVSRLRKNTIIELLGVYPLLVRSVPGVAELAQGYVKVDDLNVVKIEDLLGRDPVSPNQNYLEANVRAKVVMVTGAGGSIGSELSRQIIRLKPDKLILFDHSEFSLYTVDQEIMSYSSKDSNLEVVSILGTVTDYSLLEFVCQKYNVQTIYHAAAYKHVPLIEFNHSIAVKNNIFGTLYCAQAAIACKVETFVLISTDKAVRPTNTMGATKRFSEMILQSLFHKHVKNRSATRFAMVRFGNVLNSSGSVIPLFREQIDNGGPVTVTDPNITRYFMTIPEAASLVIQAGAMSEGGDVFLLDMGEPVRIFDLAMKMIHLSGLKVKSEKSLDGDIEIRFTGLRPGEKLYEELLIGGDALPTGHQLIMRANEEMLIWDDLSVILDDLEKAMELNDDKRVISILKKAVPEFKPMIKSESFE